MKKKLLSVILVSALTLSLLSGCSSGGADAETTGNTSTEQNSEESGNAEEPYNVTMVYIGTEQADMQRIEDAISELTLKELNMTVDFIQMSFGDYQSRMKMMLSGGDDLDIIPINVGQAAAYVNAGQVLDLTEYVDEYGQGIVESLGDNAYMGTIGGFLYGFPSHKENQTRAGIVMRKDMVDQYGIDIDSIHSLEDLEPVYEMLHEEVPGMNLLVGKQNITLIQSFDTLGDSFGVLDMWGDDLTKVVNMIETDTYVERANLLHEWYEKGYIMQDAATTTETSAALIKAGNAFSYISPIKPGFLQQANQQCGMEMCCALFDGAEYVYSTGVNFYDWGIAANSKNPEKAMQFLNFAYTSPEFTNLLNWGQEGIDYVRVEGSETLIRYPEGLDDSNATYHLNMGWEIPNQFIGYIWEGNDEDLWEQYVEFDAAATKSPAFGFTYDSTTLANELTALSNVYNQYSAALETGSADPEEILPQMKEAMYAAGLQKVMDEKQRQLDEWLANKAE